MYSRAHRLILSAVAATACLAAAAPALALSPHARDGWVLGLSYGGARGEATAPDGASGGTEDGVSPQIRFGHMFGRKFSVGASYAGWMYETGARPLKYRYAMQNILLAASWYPGDPQSAWGGFVVRGGAGWGWANFTEVELSDTEEQGHGDRTTEWGFGWELNVGYEWRLVKNMSAGLGIGVNHLDIGGDLTDTATFYPVTLNMGWYWD